MSLEALSTALSNITTANSFGTSILGKELQNQEQNGEAIAEMIKSAPAASLEHLVNPAIGGNVDLYI